LEEDEDESPEETAAAKEQKGQIGTTTT